jgi:Phage integrase, N-terminal SAM-like domain
MHVRARLLHADVAMNQTNAERHECETGRMRQSTYERYGYAIEPHIKPVLGRIKLKNLTPAQVRWFYGERLDSGLAPATVHKLHVVLHKALKAAVADGLIPRNAAAGMKLPRIIREEMDPLNQEEVVGSSRQLAVIGSRPSTGSPSTPACARASSLSSSGLTCRRRRRRPWRRRFNENGNAAKSQTLKLDQ